MNLLNWGFWLLGQSPLLNQLWMKKSFEIPKAGFSSGTAGRQPCSCTFHHLFQPFCFSCSFTYSQEKKYIYFLEIFWIPFEKDFKNHSSSLKNMCFVIDTLNVCNKEMLLISWLLFTGRDEFYMLPVISIFKTSIECFELERILEFI